MNWRGPAMHLSDVGYDVCPDSGAATTAVHLQWGQRGHLVRRETNLPVEDLGSDEDDSVAVMFGLSGRTACNPCSIVCRHAVMRTT